MVAVIHFAKGMKSQAEHHTHCVQVLGVLHGGVNVLSAVIGRAFCAIETQHPRDKPSREE